MKTIILLAALTMSSMIFAQDSLIIKEKNSVRIFTVNPSKKAQNTAGINVGILDNYKKQTINGINLQANPASLIYLLIPKAIPIPSEAESTVIINGFHFSTGGIMNGEKLNGIGISAFHHSRITSGVAINLFNNTSGNLNGLHISGLYNDAEKGNGILIAFANHGGNFNGIEIGLFNTVAIGNGLQIGIFNKSQKHRGLQIGLVNKTKSTKGFQIGFWNKNSKRTLPFINF